MMINCSAPPIVQSPSLGLRIWTKLFQFFLAITEMSTQETEPKIVVPNFSYVCPISCNALTWPTNQTWISKLYVSQSYHVWSTLLATSISSSARCWRKAYAIFQCKTVFQPDGLDRHHLIFWFEFAQQQKGKLAFLHFNFCYFYFHVCFTLTFTFADLNLLLNFCHFHTAFHRNHTLQAVGRKVQLRWDLLSCQR